MPAVTVALAAALGLALMFGLTLHAQAENVIVPGLPVTDEVTSRRGDEWAVGLCLSDVVTITMQSEAFAPFIEVFEPGAEESAAFATAISDTATLTGFVAAAAGDYTIVAAGEGLSARGPYTLSVSGAAPDAGGGADVRMAPGQLVTATLRPLRTIALGFHGCEGDVVRVDAAGDAFEPAMELFAPGEEEPLASSSGVEGGGPEGGGAAQVADQALPRSGDYTVIVFGPSRLDQGDVELLLTVVSTGAATSTLPSTVTAGSAAAPTRVSTATPIPSATPRPLGITCTVSADRLNLRSGPGLEFAPPLTVLTRDTELLAVARDPSNAWIQVQVVDTGDVGWTSAVSPFVACSGSVAGLPLGVIPPRPTATATPLPTATPLATATPLPTPTPQKLALNFVPTDGDDGNNFLRGSAPFNFGRAVALPGFRFDQITNPMVFRDRLVFAVEVFDTRVGNTDGDGIWYVDFAIQNDNGREVYTHREESPGYCLFGGGEPNCAVLFFADNDRWPGGDEIEDGFYTAVIDIVSRSAESTQWRWNFEIDRSGGGETLPPPPPDVEPTPTEVPPVIEPAPPGGGETTGDTAYITDIRLLDGRYIVTFETSGFVPVVPGLHVHFFWDTVSPDDAGVPGRGPWQLYPPGQGVGTSPFTMFGEDDRPAGASQICILVADADHSVRQGTGNCYTLP